MALKKTHGKTFDLGIHCGQLLTMQGGDVKPQTNMFVGVKNGLIAEVAPYKPKHKQQTKKFILADKDVVLPGFINGHTHLPMTLFRGLEDDVPFHVWLLERILPLEGALVTKDFVSAGVELAALECIRFGVTTVNEMYFYAEASAAVLDRAGLRGIVSQAMASFPLPEDKVLGNDKEKLFKQLHKKYVKHPRIVPALGPHAPYTCSDTLLREVVRISEEYKAPIHIHVSETKKEVDDSLKEHKKTPVARLWDLGVLTERTICAHCVHLNETDIKLMKTAGATVVYNPDSNMKLASGVAPIPQYLKAGVPVALGTDGPASNNDLSMFGVMDIGTKLQKLSSGDSTAMLAKEALLAATYNGAKALGLGDKIGSIEIGKCADFISVGLDEAHLQPMHDLVSQLVYAAQGLEVRHTVCHGKLLLENRKVKTLDTKKIYGAAERFRKKIQAKMREMRKT